MRVRVKLGDVVNIRIYRAPYIYGHTFVIYFEFILFEKYKLYTYMDHVTEGNEYQM
jgi:hypothetical protein